MTMVIVGAGIALAGFLTGYLMASMNERRG